MLFRSPPRSVLIEGSALYGPVSFSEPCLPVCHWRPRCPGEVTTGEVTTGAVTTGAVAARCDSGAALSCGQAGACGLWASAPHCPALGMHPSTPGTKAASPEAPKCLGMVCVGVCGCVRAPLSSGEGPALMLLVGPLSPSAVWGINGGWQQLPTAGAMVWVCVCLCLRPRGGDGQDGHSRASGRAMTQDISERRMWMQAQLGAASGRRLLPLLTLPSLCLNGDLIIANSQRNLCAGACRGLRANAAHSRVGCDGRAAPYAIQGWSSRE